MASILCTWYNVSFSSTPSFYVSRIAVGVSFDKKGLLEAVQVVVVVFCHIQSYSHSYNTFGDFHSMGPLYIFFIACLLIEKNLSRMPS